MGNTNIAVLVIIGITVLVSWLGWQNRELFERLKFQMDAVLRGKQYDRMFTSGFLHADTMHLFFNMFALYIFAPIVLAKFSTTIMVVIYLASILVGSVFTIIFHRKESWYSAVGASGGVSGIVFSAIIINPDMELYMIFLPIVGIPGWVFGIGYLAYSVFGMRARRDNIGHAAHMGGAFTGIVLTLAFAPILFEINKLYVLGMAIPLLALAYFAWKENG